MSEKIFEITIPTFEELKAKRNEQKICLPFKTSNNPARGWPWYGDTQMRIRLEKILQGRGVYVHFNGDKIIYVGKSTGKSREQDNPDLIYGCFLERFRREFQEKSSGNSFLYQELAKRKTINTVVFDLDEIDKLVKVKKEHEGELQSPKISKALIFEQAMIAYYFPELNREA